MASGGAPAPTQAAMSSTAPPAKPTVETRPEREQIEEFFALGCEKMLSEETRAFLAQPGGQRPGLKLIVLQRAGWDKLGIDQDFGCACLDKLGELYPGDTDLQAKCANFIATAQTTYIRALEDRKPAVLERKLPMSRATILEFFDACNTKMNTQEFKQTLRDHLETHKQVPNELVVLAQREMLEVLGFERDHGCMCLSRIGHDFPGDAEITQRFNFWRQVATSSCMQVVQQWKQDTGQEPQVSPENQQMMDQQKEAAKAVSEMPEAAQEALLEQFKKKMETFMKLPPENRMDYIKKMAPDQKAEFMKAQALLMGKMRSQGQQCQQHQPGCQAHKPAEAPKVVAGVAAPKPSQQQMM